MESGINSSKIEKIVLNLPSKGEITKKLFNSWAKILQRQLEVVNLVYLPL
jgi:hypothetical protein